MVSFQVEGEKKKFVLTKESIIYLKKFNIQSRKKLGDGFN